MIPAYIETVMNLTAFHYQQYPDDSALPVLEQLDGGDWALTRRAPDGSVVFIEVIDGTTGEFVSTAYPNPNPTTTSS